MKARERMIIAFRMGWVCGARVEAMGRHAGQLVQQTQQRPDLALRKGNEKYLILDIE